MAFTYFNGTIISIYFVPLLPVSIIIYCLNLNKMLLLLSVGKSIIFSVAPKAGSFL